MADARIRKPRRHRALTHSVRDRFRERLHVFVGDKRHRANFAGAVAALAVLLQNRQDVSVEGGRADDTRHWTGGGRLRMAGRGCIGEKRERGKKGGESPGDVGHSARETFWSLKRIVGIWRS